MLPPPVRALLAALVTKWRPVLSLAAGALAFTVTDKVSSTERDSRSPVVAQRRRARRLKRRARALNAGSKGARGTKKSKSYALGVIVAVYDDGVFAGKPLAIVHGKPAFARAYEAAKKSTALDRVVVVTDDYRISEVARQFNAEVVMITEEMNGEGRGSASRAAACAARATGGGWDAVCAVGADEPMIETEVIDACIMELENNGDEWCVMSTALAAMDEEEIARDSRPKCVFDVNGFALYFSGSLIPARMDERKQTLDANGVSVRESVGNYWHQLGVTVYDADYLRMLQASDPTPLQKQENLEMLNTLENGYKIKVVTVDYVAPKICVPEDIPRVEAVLAKRIEEKRTVKNATLRRRGSMRGSASALASLTDSPKKEKSAPVRTIDLATDANGEYSASENHTASERD